MAYVALKADRRDTDVKPTEAEQRQLRHILRPDVAVYEHFEHKHQQLWRAQTRKNPQLLAQLHQLRCLNSMLASEEARANHSLKPFRMDSKPYTQFLWRKLSCYCM